MMLFALVACQSGPAPKHIVLVDIDTFTEDRFGAVRDGEAVTPVLDGLATRGVRFSHYYAQAGWTLPSMAALLTGQWPVPLEVTGEGLTWTAAGARTLPEILELYGYTTVAELGSTLPGPAAPALTAGFDRVETRPPGTEPLASARAWVASRPTRPTFLYVHDIDLHGVDAWPNPDGPRARGRPEDWFSLFEARRRQVPARQAADEVTARYDQNLHQYDQALGEVLAGLDLDRTLLVVTSDHGEDLFVHAEGDHGALYDSVLHAPLLILAPGGRAGVVEPTLAQTVDLAPTLLAWAGATADVEMDGRSLLPWVIGAAPALTRDVYSLTDGCNASLRSDGFKLVVRDDDPRVDPRPLVEAGGVDTIRKVELPAFLASVGLGGLPLPDCSTEAARLGAVGLAPAETAPAGGVTRDPARGGSYVELFDLAADPRESVNLVDRRPDRAVPLTRALLGWLAARRDAARGGTRVPVTPEQAAALRAQGYWGFVAGPPPGPPR